MGYDSVNEVSALIKKTYYTYERFQLYATFALLYHEEPISVVELAKHIRLSDQLMQIDEHHYLIVFSFTTQDNAYKAAQNLLYSLDKHFNNHTSFIALDSFDISKSPKIVLRRLQQILAEIRKSPYHRIETEQIIEN